MVSKMLQPTDIVIAKVKGYPPWPAMVIPFEIIPQQILTKNRSKLPDESDQDSDSAENIEYSPVLTFKKFTRELTNYCVKFFHDDSYIWLNPRNLHELTLPQIEAFLSKVNSKTSKNLVHAYEMAKQGLTTGIDVWEFVEYGSSGKPDDDDYTEGENDEDEDDYVENVDSEGSSKRRPTRSSSRTKAKKPKPAPRRSTRSNTKTTDDDKNKDKHRDTDIIDESDISEDLDEESPSVPKSRSKVTTKGKAKAATKKSTKAVLPKAKTKPVIYHYEDDVDWKIVGLGPQDLELDSHPPFATKLITKKNLEIHNDLKLELKDRLSAANKMLIEYILDKNDDPDLIHLISDELAMCLSLKGKHNELWTMFLSNPEFLLNYRVLLNLKKQALQESNVLGKFLEAYEEIFDHPFQFDTSSWSSDAQIIKPEPDKNEPNPESPQVTAAG
ncbi:Ioc4p [Kluyveromyces lactis]|uniref:KLLA0F26763p n=1 Tax=Kluyveromyces lactis (strain ATCC 8585 / CBS 2359 / DSM 70799 / NBRC 1267 / NRRL Y-1140 / WM37) TaxID=284590 RepID=Q6CIG9_KLULA|nr:uncharacterized protein KLLA0_F26763g [Kluyveromyces lactis]CAG98978.1 KLLA0F26763p [Kluyveromyces lactis]|eukprot:XP_456270.1 uncharacterized protein KLLA0_F26763g [Kluyveromyces lactis]